MEKKPKSEPKQKPISAPKGAERFTASVKTATGFPLLSVHDFDGVSYQVVAILTAGAGVEIEFVRKQ